ncbi:MAG: FAD-dependent oxidoreductase, partial [Duodenibacillus sp.]|nr:FAD-dependent oxidoreductase [Duodenibacillus sp.]
MAGKLQPALRLALALFCSAAAAEQAYDVVVVGAGAAGLAAAVAAAQAGARNVVVLEKSALAGGHTALAHGTVAGVDPGDNSERECRLLLEDLQRLAGPDADPALMRTVAYGSAEALAWLTDLGVQWDDERFAAYGSPLPWSRTANRRYGGPHYVEKLTKQ